MIYAATKPAVILNATAFAVSLAGAARTTTPFDAADCPVLQVVFAGGSEAAWRAGSQGLSRAISPCTWRCRRSTAAS